MGNQPSSSLSIHIEGGDNREIRAGEALKGTVVLCIGERRFIPLKTSRNNKNGSAAHGLLGCGIGTWLFGGGRQQTDVVIHSSSHHHNNNNKERTLGSSASASVEEQQHVVQEERPSSFLALHIQGSEHVTVIPNDGVNCGGGLSCGPITSSERSGGGRPIQRHIPIFTVHLPLKRYNENEVIRRGTYTFPFTIDLPSSLPSTINNNNNSGDQFVSSSNGMFSVEYYMTAQLGTNHRTAGEIYTACYPIHIQGIHLPSESIPTMILPESMSITTAGLIPRGNIVVGANVLDTNRGKGEQLDLRLACRNDSTAKIDKISIRLIEQRTWSSNYIINNNDNNNTNANQQRRGTKKRSSHNGASTQTSTLTLYETDDVLKLPGIDKDSWIERTFGGGSSSSSSNNNNNNTYRDIHTDLSSGENQIMIPIPAIAYDTYMGQLIHITHSLEIKVHTNNMLTNDPIIHVPIRIGPKIPTTNNRRHRIHPSNAVMPPQPAYDDDDDKKLALPPACASAPPLLPLPSPPTATVIHDDDQDDNNNNIPMASAAVVFLPDDAIQAPMTTANNKAIALGTDAIVAEEQYQQQQQQQHGSSYRRRRRRGKSMQPSVPPPDGTESAHNEDYDEDDDDIVVVRPPPMNPNFQQQQEQQEVGRTSSTARPQQQQQQYYTIDTLIHDMSYSINDHDFIERRLNDNDNNNCCWSNILANISIDEYQKIISKVRISHDQPRVAVLLAQHIHINNFDKQKETVDREAPQQSARNAITTTKNKKKETMKKKKKTTTTDNADDDCIGGYTCEYAAAGVRGTTTSTFRSQTAQRLIPLCIDLQKNHNIIWNELSDWDKTVTEPYLQRALNNMNNDRNENTTTTRTSATTSTSSTWSNFVNNIGGGGSGSNTNRKQQKQKPEEASQKQQQKQAVVLY